MDSFRECGWSAFLSLGIGILATLIGVVALSMALLKPRAGLLVGVLGLAASLGAPGMGVIGMFWGRQQTESAIASESINPELKDRIREVGYAEAAGCVPVGATFGALPMVMAGIAIVVAVVKQKGDVKV